MMFQEAASSQYNMYLNEYERISNKRLTTQKLHEYFIDMCLLRVPFKFLLGKIRWIPSFSFLVDHILDKDEDNLDREHSAPASSDLMDFDTISVTTR
jgi:hypothetical protein